MSLENVNVIDAIGTEIATGNAILTIADDWDWNNETDHLIALQSKINAYLDFVESGQIWDEYPSATGRQLVIDLVSKYLIPQAAQEFLQKAAQTASRFNIQITHKHYQGT